MDTKRPTEAAQGRRDFVRRFALVSLLFSASPFLAQGQRPAESQRERAVGGNLKTRTVEVRVLEQLVAQIAVSARVLQVVENSSDRISKPPALAPGAPPLLSFRYFDGKQRHRFGNLDLVMDDAGH
jgi:hypothetical protein